MSKKVFIKTYGCQMNVYDSKRMADVLKPHGYSVSESSDDADLVILNTCHIREKAAEKVYSEIGRLKQIKTAKAAQGNDMYIAVAGCVAQAEGPEMMRRAPTIDMVLGPQTYHRLPDMLKTAGEQRAAGRNSARVLDTEFPTETKFDHLPEESAYSGPAAFLTVQEGCDKFCTFCVVPYTRGAEYSRPIADIVEEAKRLVASGVVEITLLGQNVNAYHGALADGGTANLGDLIHALDQIEGLGRIRYTTSHPRDMDDTLINAHRDVASCMPYLHLPVQSGSNAILDAMNRKHTRESYFDIIDRLRAARPDIALSSDFIVGFPGETDQDFEDTLDLVRRVKYAQAYSFKYSPRPGTPASVIEQQVDESVKSERLARLQALLNEHQLEFNTNSIGREMDILLEREGKLEGQLLGRSPYLQAVHVDVTSHENTLDADADKPYSGFMGKLVRVRITEAGPNSLKGELVGALH
ncbi:tRNA (N6-isopentenyl adenosine(37)-C2)-methylthiotransferase MiaB [Kordiimonas aquimaris]|uniref:tRNA (N6-isopentenyl adenosine(37)-C2)-methylthiotransferase MiaB n=1 Tax=Kordiimonas aquimaris TaxID=707591 RepID=UPI0021D047DB|nr:tRNA (N6-isopentenyl adenosine(37)-C2)-methylthiotransferase MiaB [Kordiimonas aquimaris]